MLSTPVVLTIFNRPDTTRQVFAEIAKVQPAQLFVVADGPRPDRPLDAALCAQARTIIEGVDWPCDVRTNYAPTNMGCGYRMASGISWVFEEVEEAIILEDDCVPHPTFFRFCEELLERYRDDERVMMISGRNHLGQISTRFSYLFGYIMMSIWGWATWRRAWQHYDLEIKLWPELRETPWLVDVLGSEGAAAHWRPIFERAYTDVPGINTWDYQWSFACWSQNGLSISPRANLIRNVGFGETATHTRNAGDERAYTPVVGMSFPLRHPPYMVRDAKVDALRFRQIVEEHKGSKQVPWSRRLLRSILPRMVREQFARL